MYIKYNVKNLLESVLFPRHFHALYIGKLQLKKIYDRYVTTDNNNRANRYANYIIYDINHNRNINMNKINIINKIIKIKKKKKMIIGAELRKLGEPVNFAKPAKLG